MAKYSDDELAVAMIYARAMYELAAEKSQVDALREELNAVAGLIEAHHDFATFLTSPTVDDEAKRKTLEKLFRGRCADLLVDSLQVINRNERQGFIGAVAAALGILDEERCGGVEVRVQTATALSASARERLRAVFAKKTGRKPRIVETVDESLVGGLVVRIGDEKLDASVARKLAVLSNVLLERASREIHGGREYVAA
ncbi:MAG: ATP synthase F1 subunit delta [Phycisphaerales bacterium]|nr:ATP synthase F1 subunit delta [Phycisphaerales bacterium]